ncbi:HWE histidine kinase domain-containing protein [Bosea sp. PAMC 26642]|uniref:HWE histidine kinase domain-containing protein n=1 Tax=Bosea sp. (strain PAMC 26642) TaxID=1792307 RepID=UPI001F1F7330|nr:HWE histidine kinase domain-containing protein [Bosea sp. PAMC 26642]
MAMVFTDAKAPENPIIFANDSFLGLTGYDRAEVLGQRFDEMMAYGATPEVLGDLAAVFDGADEGSVEVCYRRKDDSVFWTDLFISPVRDERSNIVQHFISFVDLTRHKLEQEQSRMLIDELNHRVKNTLSTVQSIVTEALRPPSSLENIKESISSRIFALSRSHDLLSARNWEGTGLHDLLDAALEPFGVANGRKERFVITGDNISVPPKVALALGIAFHELATNAVKYGAFSNEAGSILITWAIAEKSDGDRLIIRWEEKDGPPVSPPTRKGFGSQVIKRGLAHELEGTVDLEYLSGGVACTIDIPAPQGPQ